MHEVRLIQDPLSQSSRNEILLPEFQRGYDWNRAQVPRLMQSLAVRADHVGDEAMSHQRVGAPRKTTDWRGARGGVLGAIVRRVFEVARPRASSCSGRPPAAR